MGQQRERGHIRTTIGDQTFDSRREARRWQDLQLLLRAGQIRELKRQVSIALMGKNGPIKAPGGRRRFYRADFTYIEVRTGEAVIEDAKGHRTEIYELKRDILRAQGITIREV